MKNIISKSFTFEAAHFLNTTNNKKNSDIHGHSFFSEIYIEGEINENGMVIDFEELDKSIKKIKKILDHSFLNDIPGLKNPTLENIGTWIWSQLKNKKIIKVSVSRKSCGEKFTLANTI